MGEATAWTLTTVVYRLNGDGGLKLSEQRGHTIEVVGDVVEPVAGEPGRERAISVRSARVVSQDCTPYVEQ
jgi:hypothetical protein